MPSTRSGWVSLVAVLYLISGAFNLLIGLAALGVSLSGSSNVETVYVGDWPTDHLTGAGIVVIILASLQLLLGAGIWQRARWAWVAGLIVASLVIVSHLFYVRLLDGWAVGGVIINILIIWILVAKESEFVS
jgi:O-antigen ligase